MQGGAKKPVEEGRRRGQGRRRRQKEMTIHLKKKYVFLHLSLSPYLIYRIERVSLIFLEVTQQARERAQSLKRTLPNKMGKVQ